MEGPGVFRRLDTVPDLADFECQVGRAGGKLLSTLKVSGLQSSWFTECAVLRGHVV